MAIPTRPENYLQYFEQDRVNDIEYPVNPVDIPKLEERLNLSINLYSDFDDLGKFVIRCTSAGIIVLFRLTCYTLTDTTRESRTLVGYQRPYKA